MSRGKIPKLDPIEDKNLVVVNATTMTPSLDNGEVYFPIEDFSREEKAAGDTYPGRG